MNIKDFFEYHREELQSVEVLAWKVKEGIQAIDPFIEQSTSAVCPRCPSVCCVNKHAYYSGEDLIYIYALGLRTHTYEAREDADPCQFLSHEGCMLQRALRPSGCNWYFCEPLYDYMESVPGSAYSEFDNSLRDLASLWMDLIREFSRKYREITGSEPDPADLARTMRGE